MSLIRDKLVLSQIRDMRPIRMKLALMRIRYNRDPRRKKYKWLKINCNY